MTPKPVGARRRPRFWVRVQEHQELPRFYGIAWHDHPRKTVVACPVPMNWIASWARDVWWFLLRPRPAWSDDLRHAEYMAMQRKIRRAVSVEVLRSISRTRTGGDPFVDAAVWLLQQCDDPRQVMKDAGFGTSACHSQFESTVMQAFASERASASGQAQEA